MPHINSVAGVELRDIASGKLARVFSGPFDILHEGPGAGSSHKRPCRAVVVTAGSATIKGIDGVDVILPDMGGPWQWDVQAMAIILGDGVVLY